MTRLMMMMSAMMSLAACGGATDTAAEGCGPDALSTCSAPAQPARAAPDAGLGPCLPVTPRKGPSHRQVGLATGT